MSGLQIKCFKTAFLSAKFENHFMVCLSRSKRVPVANQVEQVKMFLRKGFHCCQWNDRAFFNDLKSLSCFKTDSFSAQWDYLHSYLVTCQGPAVSLMAELKAYSTIPRVWPDKQLQKSSFQWFWLQTSCWFFTGPPSSPLWASFSGFLASRGVLTSRALQRANTPFTPAGSTSAESLFVQCLFETTKLLRQGQICISRKPEIEFLSASWLHGGQDSTIPAENIPTEMWKTLMFSWWDRASGPAYKNEYMRIKSLKYEVKV